MTEPLDEGTTATIEGLVPKPTPETQPYWDAASRHELSIQHCDDCSRFYFYPRPFCPRCGSANVSWRTASGDATVNSFVINRRPVPPFASEPQVIALVDLAEGPRMLTNLVGFDEPTDIRLDMPVHVDFVARGEITLPVFRDAREA